MFRSWFVWLSIILVALCAGWFWLLTHDLKFSRVESEPPASASENKPG